MQKEIERGDQAYVEGESVSNTYWQQNENVEFGRGGLVHYFGKSTTYVHTFLLLLFTKSK